MEFSIKEADADRNITATKVKELDQEQRLNDFKIKDLQRQMKHRSLKPLQTSRMASNVSDNEQSSM